jgi:translocation and assembly module TamB
MRAIYCIARDTISGLVKHLAVNEQAGLNLKELRTNFLYSAKGGVLRDLYLQTDHTILRNYLSVSYPSLEALKTNMQTLKIESVLQRCVVGINDILLFAPDLRKQQFFANNQHAVLKLDAVLSGFLNALDIKQFGLSGLSNTVIAINGKLNGLPDANKVNYNLNVQQLRSSARDVNPLLPASVLKQIRLPEVFSIVGQIFGNTKDYNPRLAIATSSGNASVTGMLAMSPGKNRERYDLVLKTMGLNLGYILRQDTMMGKVTADFQLKGQSFDVHTMTASVKGQIRQAYLKGYDYNSITIDGNMAAQTGKLTMISADSNAHLNLVATASFTEKFPSFIADLNIDSIDLHALKLYDQEFKASTRIHANVPVMYADYPQGDITFYQPVIVNNGQRYFLDSMFISSHATADSGQDIVVNTEVLYATLTGHIPLTKIGGAIQEHINRHYALTDSIMPAKKTNRSKLSTPTQPLAAPPATYDIQFAAHLVDRPLLHALAPGLKSLDSVMIDASVTPRDLNFSLTGPNIVYGTNTISGATAKINESDSALAYNIGINKFAQPRIELLNTTLAGNVSQHNITATLRTQDSAKKDRFALDASLQQSGSDNILSLHRGLMINYKNWTVTEPNKIVFSPLGFYVQDFKINSGNESIAINSQIAQYNAPLTAKIDNFNIGDITQIISKGDTLLANGLLSGTIDVKQVKPQPLLTADLQIQHLAVLNDTIGDLTAKAGNKDANIINADVAITGHQNDIQLKGDYFMNVVDGNNFQMKLLLRALNLKSFEGLAMKQIYNSSGFVRGELDVTGTTSKPVITGELHTDQLTTTIAALGAPYKMPAEKMVFTKDAINLNRFNIVDSAGNKIVFDGGVKTTDFSNPYFDMRIRANKFRAIHSTVQDNKNFYGDISLTTNLDVQGTPTKPNVEGSIRVLKGTKFTVVVPGKDVTLQDSKGIVEFIDMRDTNRYKILAPRDTMPKLALSPGSDINVNISTEPEAEFNVIIDAATGDFLKVRGEAALNASVSPGGELALTGNYELKEGEYQLNYNLIKRNFKIQSGSTIIFAGDPLTANMDITAVYTANIPPYDLVEKQVPDPSQLNYYKQRLPFNIALKLKGELLKPNISFDVLLPEGGTYRLSSEGQELVQAKLTQLRTDTSELNKQVFAVLILNRFVGDDPFSSDAGNGGINSVARQSVSRFISEQLNKYANSLIKGIDLSLDLVSADDYTTGERRDRTDLNVEASKRLLNDRLTLTIGNNFELEGPQTNNNNSSVIPGNLAADYKLSSDGRYTVRVYRKNQDEGVIEGFVTETGVNFIVTLDYNRFKNLFNKKKRQKARDARNMKDAAEKKEEESAGTEKQNRG